MRAQILIHYDIQGVWRGVHRYAEHMPIEIREPGENEAPISVEWEYGVTRWFDGAHYREIATVFSENMSRPEQELALSAHFNSDGAHSYSYTRAYTDTKSMSADRKYSERRHPDAAKHLKRLRAIEKTEALAADCILVGGKIWMRCGEPRLVYRPASRHHAASLTVDTTDWNAEKDRYRFGKDVEYPSLDIAAYSARLDAPENLQAVMERWAIVPDVPEFTLRMPETIIRDEFPDMIKEAAYGLVFAWKFGELSDKASDDMRRMAADLSEYLDETDDGDIDHEHLVRQLTHVMESLPGVERKKRDLLDIVIRRWDDRPIGSDLAMRPLIGSPAG
ncbi:hypothetical protein HFN89_05895 [Rhizobium laguerreae]|nr:hypothetical protein [Rhizobium laguerreae]